MFVRIKIWLLTKLIGDVFKGITHKDFFDPNELPDNQYRAYCLAAHDVFQNKVFQNEIRTLREKQERYFVNKAQTELDMVWAKASLYVLDAIEKRFRDLSESLVSHSDEEEQ